MKEFLNTLRVLMMVTAITVCTSAIASELPSFSIDMSDEDISTRIEFIQSRFDQGKLHAQLWQYGWLAGFSASVASRTYIVASEDDTPERFDAAVGIFTSLSGVLSLALKPLPSSSAASKLSLMSETTAEQRKIKLQYAEQLLTVSAAEAKRRRGWTIQGVFLLEQIIAGLAIGIIDDRPSDGLKAAVLGMLASELFTFTMPTQSITDVEAYSSNLFKDNATPVSSQPFFIAPHGQGIRMVYFW